MLLDRRMSALRENRNVLKLTFAKSGWLQDCCIHPCIHLCIAKTNI